MVTVYPGHHANSAKQILPRHPSSAGGEHTFKGKPANRQA